MTNKPKREPWVLVIAILLGLFFLAFGMYATDPLAWDATFKVMMNPKNK